MSGLAAPSPPPAGIGLAALRPRLIAESDAGTEIIFDQDALTITAPGSTNLFCDPRSGRLVATAPRLLAPLPGDGWLRARVEVGFAAIFDVGALLVWVDEDHWAKLCFERAPDGRATVVSVVTRGRSDDANAFAVDAAAMHLRAARIGDAFAFHASLDGESWTLIRYFEIGRLDRARIGFTAHSSLGSGVRARFTGIAFAAATLADIRGVD